MKRYEKIILFIFIVGFGLQVLNFPGKLALFVLASWLLATSYLIGGYWLFGAKESKKTILSVVSGIAISSSLFSFPFVIWINTTIYSYFLPIVNGLLCLFLVAYLLQKRKSKEDFQNIRLIFLRSLVILILSSFFTYTPISFKPFRDLLYALNNGRAPIQNNLLMFDYAEKSREALEKEDCENAIHYGIKAIESGKAWLRITPDQLSTIDHSTLQKELLKISGSYTNLYNSYKCMASQLFTQKEYNQALGYYLKADSILNVCELNSEYWKTERAYSMNKIGLCHKKLQNYYSADSLFVKAVEQYKKVKNTPDRNLALFMGDFAKSLSEQGEHEHSILLYQTCNSILERDFSNEENKKEILSNFFNLIESYIQTDNQEQAELHIKKAFEIIDLNTANFCHINALQGIYHQKSSAFKKAHEVLRKSLQCYKNTYNDTHPTIAENYFWLAQIEVSLAKYDHARNSINKGIEIVVKNFGRDNQKLMKYLRVEAFLEKELGNYQKALKNYLEILNYYNHEFGENTIEASDILSNIADLEIALGEYDLAKLHSNRSLSIANQHAPLNTSSASSLLNNAAYVNYSIGNYNLADSLYQKTIKVNQEHNLQTTAPFAIALNGLGLLRTVKKDYYKADSLFSQTVKLQEDIYSQNHPYTGIVYMNYAHLKIEQNQISEAKKMLQLAQNIQKKFFDANHDFFADIYVAFGNISIKERQYKTAKDYYGKALTIYQNKFDKSHPKTLETKEKLKKLQFY